VIIGHGFLDPSDRKARSSAMGASPTRHTVQIPLADDSETELLAKIARELIAGDEHEAKRLLAPIAGITCETRPISPMPTIPRESWPVGSGVKTKNPSPNVIASIFVRDAFTCCYCGRRTIPPNLLRLLSSRFPADLPYHKNWKRSVTHRVYWDISTALDHVHPVSLGGSWADEDNLVTACARCQYQKSNLPLELLGWPNIRHLSEWDGLTRLYDELWEAVGQPDGDPSSWRVKFAVAWAAASASAVADVGDWPKVPRP
jgi:5-methylcytosine-specific restriction endonuclease McrA